jgi:TPR repeat protein
MKLLSKCFLVVLLLTVSTIGKAEIPDEEYRTLISHLRSKQFEKGYRIAKHYADGGSIKAYVVLAQMHMNGDFVERNKTLGKYYFQMASDNGDGYASGKLALLAESEREAFGYQYLGAQQGDTDSMIGLMFSYFHGKGTV